MIDWEYEIYDALRTYVDSKIPGLAWSTVASRTPSAIPTVCFEQIRNPANRKSIYDSRPILFNPAFAVRVFVAQGNKLQAKSILAACDEYLSSIGLLISKGPSTDTSVDGAYAMYSLYDSNAISADGRIYTR